MLRILIFPLLACISSCSQLSEHTVTFDQITLPIKPSVNISTIADAWSQNSINAVIFRHNSVVSHENFQYVAFYNEKGQLVLAKRKLATDDWQVEVTQYSGNIHDAHNSASIMVDGNGYLHVSWDHHGNPLHYARSIAPGSLSLSAPLSMTSKNENSVTYPEFYRLTNGNLLFLYRDGSSGKGHLMMNYYQTATQQWTQRQAPLIDGQGERNAYWQMTTDQNNHIHLFWNWRESPDVASNHDLGYARSFDEGLTWQKTDGSLQPLPITASNAEYAFKIPQNHELINTTSMTADKYGNPYIATYWRSPASLVPQYRVVYHDGKQWHMQQVTERKEAFSLSGGGTKAIPISRPQILVDATGSASTRVYMIFRDQERGSKVSLAVSENIASEQWQTIDLTEFSVGMWEPSYDTERWKTNKELHLYLQNVGQGDGETVVDKQAQPVSILSWQANK